MVNLVAPVREKVANFFRQLLLNFAGPQNSLHESPCRLQIAHAQLDLAAAV
jgi:hypothetical protein